MVSFLEAWTVLMIDRFGDTHWDFCTVEYGLGEKPKAPQMWQSCRGSE